MPSYSAPSRITPRPLPCFASGSAPRILSCSSPSTACDREPFSPAWGLPHLPRSLSLHAVPTTPVDPNRCARRWLPGRCGLPRFSGGSASTTSLSRPAQASLTLRPVELLSHPRWPLSQGSDLARYRPKPLVSYQTYRQLSGWDFHPPAICAAGAH